MTFRRIIIGIPDHTGQNIESNIHKSDLKCVLEKQFQTKNLESVTSEGNKRTFNEDPQKMKLFN